MSKRVFFKIKTANAFFIMEFHEARKKYVVDQNFMQPYKKKIVEMWLGYTIIIIKIIYHCQYFVCSKNNVIFITCICVLFFCRLCNLSFCTHLICFRVADNNKRFGFLYNVLTDSMKRFENWFFFCQAMTITILGLKTKN